MKLWDQFAGNLLSILHLCPSYLCPSCLCPSCLLGFGLTLTTLAISQHTCGINLQEIWYQFCSFAHHASAHRAFSILDAHAWPWPYDIETIVRSLHGKFAINFVPLPILPSRFWMHIVPTQSILSPMEFIAIALRLAMLPNGLWSMMLPDGRNFYIIFPAIEAPPSFLTLEKFVATHLVLNYQQL